MPVLNMYRLIAGDCSLTMQHNNCLLRIYIVVDTGSNLEMILEFRRMCIGDMQIVCHFI
jgi:hypothetical protein